MKKYIVLGFVCLFAILAPTFSVFANPLTSVEAPDSTSKGPYSVSSAEYRFPAMVDPDVLSDRMTEIWAKVFYPKNILQLEKAPLIVFLHGNHATCGRGSNPRHDTNCEYTAAGVCPTGFVPVPNHEGYNYLAENLASWGYWVVSVNANRGITCGGGASGDSGLNLARGRLVLKHLNLLHTWATTGGAPTSLGLGAQGLIGKIDFTSVGLMGHSRGGEGMRAAYNLYLDKDSRWPSKIPGLSVKAVFEIGAVDGQTSRTLDANGTVWNQLLPMCDGDVSDLQGRYPFERMLLNRGESLQAQKSLYEVWGANHNFFNTEWQSSDAGGCSVGKPIFDSSDMRSLEQQTVALASITSFFRSRLGTHAEGRFNQHFNPLNTLPQVVTKITQVDRDFTTSPSLLEAEVVDDFDRETGLNSSGYENGSQQIKIQHKNWISRHVQRVATISWEAASEKTFFEAIWTASSVGRNIQGFSTLDFRVAREKNALNKDASTDFTIRLQDAQGHFSNAVAVSQYALVNGPGSRNQVLKAVRIPLTAFTGIDLTAIRGVTFIFNKTQTGAIALANIRLHRRLGLGEAQLTKNLIPSYAEKLTDAPLEARVLPVERVPAKQNAIRVLQKRALSGEATVEIIVSSQVPFPAMNRLPILTIGDKEFTLSRYSDVSELKELTFTLTAKEYQSVAKKDLVTVQDGKIWEFGSLTK